MAEDLRRNTGFMVTRGYYMTKRREEEQREQVGVRAALSLERAVWGVASTVAAVAALRCAEAVIG